MISSAGNDKLKGWAEEPDFSEADLYFVPSSSSSSSRSEIEVVEEEPLLKSSPTSSPSKSENRESLKFLDYDIKNNLSSEENPRNDYTQVIRIDSEGNTLMEPRNSPDEVVNSSDVKLHPKYDTLAASHNEANTIEDLVSVDSNSFSQPVEYEELSLQCGPRHLPSPEPIEKLSTMTFADVRLILEPFFLKKEALEKQFSLLRGTFLTPEGYAKQVDPIHERYLRLVNIENWGSGVSTIDDVLLPKSLVRNLLGPRSESESGKKEKGFPTRCFVGMKPHQINGVRFLWNILVEGPAGRVPALGCILAHTMGLGKTCQVVVFLHLFMKAFGGTNSGKAVLLGPSQKFAKGHSTRSPQRILIVVPKSTQSAWVKEFEKWSLFFPEADRLKTIYFDEKAHNNCTSRLEVFLAWRREGGIFLIGYEALAVLLKSIFQRADSASDPAEEGLYGVPDTYPVSPRRGLPHYTFQMSDKSHKKSLNENNLADSIKSLLDKDPFTELLICDEAHRLKSTSSQIVKVLNALHPIRRLLMTGTPLQNHLEEYWAMVDFALHKYFHRRRFREYFINPIEASADTRAPEADVSLAKKKTFTLIRELRHFVQRVDSQPLKDELPPLHEFVVMLQLSKLQTDLYLRFLKVVRSEYGDKFNFLQAVSYAGKIVAHPQLIYSMGERLYGTSKSSIDSQKGPQSGRSSRVGGSSRIHSVSDSSSSQSSSSGSELDIQRTSLSQQFEMNQYATLCNAPSNYVPSLEDGVKIDVAVCIIRAAMQNNEKTLLFSLSTTLLDFFETMLAKINERWLKDQTIARAIQYCRLDGTKTSSERARIIQDFAQRSDVDLFLLSTKAGGVGITITAATRVILLDSSFNPADDQQAIGRAYRYGQTRPVYVYRLLCRHTLEHRIFEQKLAKEWLFKTVVEGASLKRDALSGIHLRAIFQLIGRSSASIKQVERISPSQQNSTEHILSEEDPFVLGKLAEKILYVQRHNVFLEEDHQYGDEESEFYKEYQKTGVFNLSESNPELNYSIITERRSEMSKELQYQAQSLTGLLDDIIRSRVGSDPMLEKLLHRMGVQIDTVDRGRSSQAVTRISSNNFYESSKNDALMGNDIDENESQSSDSSDDDVSDESTHDLISFLKNSGSTPRQQKRKRGSSQELRIDPRKYAPFEPGRTLDDAIEVSSSDDEVEI